MRLVRQSQTSNRFVQNELPVSDTRLSPFVQLEHKTTRFLATHDVETLALLESYSLGQQAALRLYPALRAVGSSRDLVGSAAWLGYTWPVDSGLVRVLANSSIEAADESRHQASAQGAVRFVSPRLGFMRLVADSVLSSTYQNYLNRKLVLGGDTRPRGYFSAIFRGAAALLPRPSCAPSRSTSYRRGWVAWRFTTWAARVSKCKASRSTSQWAPVCASCSRSSIAKSFGWTGRSAHGWPRPHSRSPAPGRRVLHFWSSLRHARREAAYCVGC